MAILFMAIGAYPIYGYRWSFYLWLLVTVLLMVIDVYSINGYCWLLYWWMLVLINGHYINRY